MNSIELIRRLSAERAVDFFAALPWINPIPLNAVGVVKKIELARSRLLHAQDRQGTTEETLAERATLSRLKDEIQKILSNS
ncbi:hypothetical protein [Pseudomonas sp. UBA6310]|uniref:hypothetical protein n=1 Tax=Pseudomonas sp. UBA6310 TaxID=1947327 RepID=UPI00257A7F0A|nr:hypothetical protein [Pseudomonas sp. UBA6310]